jgi:hypothetical protein
MASTHKHIRSSTANKRPTTAIADGQIALNTNSSSPGLFFKDSTGATIIKVGPVHIGATAPNATPPSGGSSGNSTGEIWLDTSLTPNGVKIWDGSAWVNATPIGSTTVQGLLELATNAETQTGSDTARAVTPAGLQSKLSDSTSTTSSTTIASSTAVKAAYDLANAALPKSGGTVTGNLEIGSTGSLSFEGATADAFETTIAITDPTADRTITLPDTTGTVVTTGDTGTVTSTMILDGTIVNGDINASAAIAGTKISPDFGSQNTTTTGTSTAASFIPTSSTAPSNGVYLPSANNVAISTNGTGRLFVDASGNVGVGSSSPDKWSDANVTQGTFKGALIGAVNIEGNRTTSSDVGRLAFWQATNRIAYIGAERAGADNSGALRFTTTNAGSESERMRLDSSGRLGVGTSSPSSALDVSGAISLGAVAIPSAGTARIFSRNTDSSLYIQTAGGNTVNLLDGSQNTLASFGSSTISLNTGNTPRLYIDSSGRVGLGTSSPSRQFSLSDANPTATFRSSSTTGQCTLFFGDSDSDARGAITYENNGDKLGLWSAGGQKLTIDSSGNVGIGTSTPSNAKLDVRDDVNYPVRWGSTSAQFGELSYETGNCVIGATSGNKLTLRSAGTAAITIDTSQRVGIGTTGPLTIFDVKPSTNRHIVFSASSTYANNAVVGVDDAGAEIALGIGGSPIQFITGLNERARIDSSGRLLVGASSAPSAVGPVQIVDTVSPVLVLARNDTSIVAGNNVGEIRFFSNDSTAYEHCATIAATADGDYADGDKPTRLVFSTTPDGLSSPQEVFRINSASELVSVPVYNNTSAVAANMAINSSGKFLRATSSAKYKKDIETLQDSYADALLNVRPVWYRSTCKADNPSHGYWGFIAEEVAAIDPRLVFWKTVEVNYDENGSAVETSCDPEPEGVQYDRFVPHLLNLVKRQQEQIEAMEARLSALEAS